MRMKKISTVVLGLGMLSLVGCGGGTAASSSGSTTASGSGSTADSAPRFGQISVDEVAAGITGPERRLAVFDANSRQHYDERHVPGATWVDYDAIAREQLPTDAATPLVFYCWNESCSASHVAAESAIAMGFSSVSVMGAGIEGWAAAGQPVESATTATP
jgi:rhodanese-related sulfurtransferase